MTSSMRNVRRGVLIALSAMFAATAALGADTQVTGEVTVQADRPTTKVVGRSPSGIPIVLSAVKYRVDYSDLQLANATDAQTLKTRVRDAARAACADLEKLYLQPAVRTGDCTRKAEDDAMPQVLSAIAAAEARKTAAD